MSDSPSLIMIQFLSWVADRPRSYAETMDACGARKSGRSRKTGRLGQDIAAGLRRYLERIEH